MQQINVRILKQRIISSDISISKNLSKKFELAMECRAQMKRSKDEKNNSILLNLELIINSKDEDMKIKLVSDVIFGLDELPDEYNELAEKTLVPMARESLLNSLDEILLVMGYNKLELAKKM